MDGTFNEYMRLTPEQAQTEVRALKAAVQRCGGSFCFIWHNETLGFQYHWQGWEKVLLESLKHGRVERLRIQNNALTVR
jgi:hypothetical protein